MSNKYNPFRVGFDRTTSQGWVAKSATQPWALLFNRFAVEVGIAVKMESYAALGETAVIPGRPA
jgi:hypothetical protein